MRASPASFLFALVVDLSVVSLTKECEFPLTAFQKADSRERRLRVDSRHAARATMRVTLAKHSAEFTYNRAILYRESPMKDLFPYGLDAPPVVRNLALAALVCWLMFGVSFTNWLPITINGLIWPAMSFSFGAAAMMWSSGVGKLRRRERLLNQLTWRGNESVLDIGCGRGLMAVAAARRVPGGRVIGIDIWQSEDLSGNGAEAVAANAAREGVPDRVTTQTADMRALTFESGSMDIVVSSMAIHNIYKVEGRDRAIDEIVRVLAPWGQVLIDDVRHVPQYATRLRAAGFEMTVSRGTGSWFWRLVSFGTLAPGTIIGRKSSL